MFFVGGVKCSLLGQDFMRKFQCNWEYCEKSLVLNYDLFNQRGEYNDSTLRVLGQLVHVSALEDRKEKPFVLEYG